MTTEDPASVTARAEPLVMPQDEYELVKWVFEMTGGPAFPVNAATACRIAARRNFGGNGEVFARLAEAIDGAKPGGPPSLGALRAWLECSGWTEQPPGQAGSIWVKGSARVAVTLEEDPLLVEGAVTRLAAATGRSVADMTALIVRGEVDRG